MNLMILRKRILFAFILSGFTNLIVAQVTVKRNLNVVVGDTTKFTTIGDGADEARINVEAFNKQFGLTLKHTITDTALNLQSKYFYDFKNIHSSELLPWNGIFDLTCVPALGVGYVRVGIQNEMTTRYGQYVNGIYNYLREKPNNQAPNGSQSTAILNKMDTISNQLNGVYNSVRVPNSRDIKFFRNYIDETLQNNPNGVVQGLYNDFEMKGNKNNYGVYNVMKSNNGYAPGGAGVFVPGSCTNPDNYDYEVIGVKNIFKRSDSSNVKNTSIDSIAGYLQKTIGVLNDMNIYGGFQSNGYGVYNLMKIPKNSITNVYGVRTEIIPGIGGYTVPNAPGIMIGIYSSVDSAYTNTALAAYFNGNVTVNGTLLQMSDVSLKENINDLSGAISIVKSLAAKTYNLKSEKDNSERKLHSGFIAQDVEKVAPNMVTTMMQPGKTIIKEQLIESIKYESDRDNQGNPTVKSVKVIERKEIKTEEPPTQLKAVNYIEIIPILLQAIKEQQVIIEQLQADVEKLKKK